MLTAYIRAALGKAKYEILPDDQSFYAEIPGFQGVYANAGAVLQRRHRVPPTTLVGANLVFARRGGRAARPSKTNFHFVRATWPLPARVGQTQGLPLRLPSPTGAGTNLLEACRDELEEVLEEWILFRISRHLPLPVVDGMEAVKEVA